MAKGGKIQHRAMTAQAVLVRLRYLADNAGITVCSSSPATQRYDRRPEEAKRKAGRGAAARAYVAPPSLLVPVEPVDSRESPLPDYQAEPSEEPPAGAPG